MSHNSTRAALTTIVSNTIVTILKFSPAPWVVQRRLQAFPASARSGLATGLAR